MKSFRQFLHEEYLRLSINEGSYIPAPNARVGSNYPDTAAGWEQWKTDTKENAKNLRKQAEEDTEKAEHEAENLETTEKVATAIKAGADAALTAGAFLVPVVGPAINAAVKSTEAGIDLSQGKKLSAGMNIADAALPYAGQIAGAINSTSKIIPFAGNIANKTQKAISGAKTTFTGAINPISVALETTAKKTGVKELVSTGIEKGTEAAAKAAEKFTPRIAQSLNVGTEHAAKAVGKASGELGSESGIRIVSDVTGEKVGEKVSEKISELRREKAKEALVSSQQPNSFKSGSGINISNRELTPRFNKPKA
jgi:hypothetical protein